MAGDPAIHAFAETEGQDVDGRAKPGHDGSEQRRSNNIMANVSIRNVRKAFGSTEVLHGVSVDIADGEFVVLVGPSGCGKSTLLRMIAGLENITAGEIAIGGRVVNDVAAEGARHRHGVPELRALSAHDGARQHGLLAEAGEGAEGRDRPARSSAPPRSSASAQLLDRYPRQLSGGQRQRVAMGRAIVRDPQVFLFDEPLSNLDAKLRVQMRAEIKELHQRLKTTTVYVTHDQIEAMTMADKIVVMNDGNVEQVGAPLELYDRPANLFVAGFIGSPAMNFLKGKVERRRASRPRAATRRCRCRRPRRLRRQAGRLRHPARALPARPQRRLPAKVHVVEPTGSETQVLAEFAGASVLCAFRERVSAQAGRDDPHHARPVAGASVRCRHRPAVVRLKPQGCGLRPRACPARAGSTRPSRWCRPWRSPAP